MFHDIRAAWKAMSESPTSSSEEDLRVLLKQLQVELGKAAAEAPCVVRSSRSSSSLGPEDGARSPRGLGQRDWRLLLEIGSSGAATAKGPFSLAVLHPIHELAEPGATIDLLCDYLDSSLVPSVLRQPALQEDALQCPCERCFGAAQAARRLREDPVLSALVEAGALTFLGEVLQGAVEEGVSSPGADSKVPRSSSPDFSVVALGAEALAILCASAKLQDRGGFQVPAGVIKALVAAINLALQLGSAHWSHLVKALYIVRNMVGNHAQAMQLSADCFRDSARSLWKSCSVASRSASEGRSQGRYSGNVWEPPNWTDTGLSSSSAGNPQESDDFTSGVEVLHPLREGDDELDECQEGSRACGPLPLRGLGSAEQLVLQSLVFQGLFQLDESLRHRLLAMEESTRLQLLAVTRGLQSEDLQSSSLTRLAFQGLRLYVLVCRSSHLRRQYVVLPPALIEEERRAVAFLLSLSPPAQRCCVLLRAMAQDVHSWLLWQSQAPLRAGTLNQKEAEATRAPLPGVRPRRDRQRAKCGARSTTATSSDDSLLAANRGIRSGKLEARTNAPQTTDASALWEKAESLRPWVLILAAFIGICALLGHDHRLLT